MLASILASAHVRPHDFDQILRIYIIMCIPVMLVHTRSTNDIEFVANELQ